MDDIWFLGIGCRETAANTEVFGTASKGNTVKTESFGTCTDREFAEAGNADATVIFGA